ncbi:MAG TPA: hypothetical protein VL126_09740 [Bacteroidota bacterium]|nr:hypothetical protein [Bacteroidota bacterium]
MKRRGLPAGALFVLSMAGLMQATRTSGAENIRTVQYVMIFASGLLAGVALALLLTRKKGPD